MPRRALLDGGCAVTGVHAGSVTCGWPAMRVTPAAVSEPLAAPFRGRPPPTNPLRGMPGDDGGHRQYFADPAVASAATSRPSNAPRTPGIHGDAHTLGGGAELRLADVSPPLGPRLRGPPARSEALIHLTMTGLMARPLTGEITIPGASRPYRIKPMPWWLEHWNRSTACAALP